MSQLNTAAFFSALFRKELIFSIERLFFSQLFLFFFFFPCAATKVFLFVFL